MSQLHDDLKQAMKQAMREKQKERLTVIRMLLAVVKQYEVDQREKASDEIILAMLDKQLKQRKDSVAVYKEAGRDELAQKEAFEILVIQEFLPEALTEQEIQVLIDDTIKQLDAQGMQDMGKVMGNLKPQLQGRADIAEVSQLIKNRLSN